MELEKLQLEQNQNRTLSLYYFITKKPIIINQPGLQTPISVKEEVYTALNYDLDQALKNAVESLAPGTQIIVAGNKPVKEILDKIEDNERREQRAKEMNLETFKMSLKLSADKYITDPNDKGLINQLIEKIHD